MEDFVLEFSSVSEARSCVEAKITELKGQLDCRLQQILENLSKIEPDFSKNELNEGKDELNRLRAYRTQTISIFGHNAPNIEIIDQKISEIESLANKDPRPIKINWKDDQLIAQISELGCVTLDPPSQNDNKYIKPLETIIPKPRNNCDNVILKERSDPQIGNKYIKFPVVPKKNSYGETITAKPPAPIKPLTPKPFQKPVQVQKAQSIDASLELTAPNDPVMPLNDPVLDPVPPQEVILPRSISVDADVKLGGELGKEGRGPLPNPPALNDLCLEATVQDGYSDQEHLYTEVDNPEDEYCAMSLDATPPALPLNPPPFLVTTPRPNPDSEPSAKLLNISPNRPDAYQGAPHMQQKYEDFDLLAEEEKVRLEESERKLTKSMRFPRFPIIVCCPEGPSTGQIMKPKAICVNRLNGTLYVAEKGNSRVQVFSAHGEHVRFFVDKPGSNKMNNPYGICIANNQVYVTQSSSHCVHIYTLNGAFVKKFGREGTGDAKFKLPSNITTNPTKKQIYICDTGNDRVQAFDFSNSFCKCFGVGQLLKPVDIEIDSSGKIVVLDRGPKCVHVFGLSGERLFSLISFATYKQVINPLFFTLNKQDEIFLSDYARNCVFVFSMDGGLKGQIGEDGAFVEPRGLVVDTNGRLAVLSCNHTGCLQFYDM